MIMLIFGTINCYELKTLHCTQDNFLLTLQTESLLADYQLKPLSNRVYMYFKAVSMKIYDPNFDICFEITVPGKIT